MVVHYLPALPVGKTYQLWAITGQRALSASVFQVDAIGHTALMVPVAVAHPDRFEIRSNRREVWRCPVAP